jgi:hypothetical protein
MFESEWLTEANEGNEEETLTSKNSVSRCPGLLPFALK